MLPEATTAHDRRLRGFVWFDAATAATAVVVVVAAWALVLRSPWLLVLAAMVGCSGLVMLAGLAPLARGDTARTVLFLAVANWTIALGATAIATFAWPLMVLAALLPAVFAAPYTPRGRLRPYLWVSLAVSMGVAALGLLQDFSGLTADLPGWVPPSVTIFFTPFLGGMIAQIGMSNSSRLQVLLGEAERNSEELRASRARVVAATDRERKRIERDLHDGTQQRLVAIGMQLSLLRELCLSAPAAAAGAVVRLREDVRETQVELRLLAQGMFPQVLTEHGLAAALESAADRMPNPVTLSLADIGRHEPGIEAAVYFCCVEALQNVAKHAGPAVPARVTVRSTAERNLVFEVADEGAGFDRDRVVPGSGLENMADRIGAAGGVLTVTSALGRGTTVIGRISSTRLG